MARKKKLTDSESALEKYVKTKAFKDLSPELTTIEVPKGSCILALTPEGKSFYYSTKVGDKTSYEKHEEICLALTALLTVPGFADNVLNVFRDLLKNAMIDEQMESKIETK